MAKTYEDVSRRGLIKLCHDFDDSHDGELQCFLTDHSDEYENIRPVECVIDRADQIVETMSGTVRSIKAAICNRDCKAAVVGVLDTLVENHDVIVKSVNLATSFMK